MEEFRLKNTGYCLRYHDLPGKEPAILFVHGMGCAGSFDYPQVAARKELSGHRRILVDLLGSGFSDKPEDFCYTIAAHAACLLELVEGLELDKFILFGHSIGGAIALTLANSCRSRLDSVILSESNLDCGGGFASRAIAAYGLENFLAFGCQNLIEESRRSGNAMWAASVSVTLSKALHAVARSAVEGQTPSWRDILYSLECPRTFIFGERSLPDKDEQALAGHGIRVEVVGDAGHSMAWENPQGLAQAIRKGVERD